jgi:hypothetical protein
MDIHRNMSREDEEVDVERVYSDSDSDSDLDVDLEIDEEALEFSRELCGTTPEFCSDVQKLKYTIYTIIVLEPKDAESDDAQNNSLLQKYINALDMVYQSALEKVNNNHTVMADKKELNSHGYSDESVSAINSAIEHINDYVTNNANLNKIAYLSYITNQFHTFPFFQLPSFPE